MILYMIYLKTKYAPVAQLVGGPRLRIKTVQVQILSGVQSLDALGLSYFAKW